MAAIANALITVPRAAKKRSFFLREPPSSASGSILFWRSLPSSGRRWISGPIRASQPSEKVGGDGGDPAASSASAKILNFGKPLLNFASNNFLPLALVGGVVLGLANPTLGCLADKYALSKFSTFGIFIISGLTLRSEAVGAAAKAWSVGVFGLIQLQPQEFVTGLAIFSCMPTTLSSGVALTHLAGGNSALALAMTVISNLLGILIVPFSISKYIAEGVGVSVPTEQLLRSLVVTLLVPLIFGKAVEKAVEMLEKNDLEDLWAFIGEIFQEEGKLYCFLHIILPILIGLADFVDQNRKIFSHISAILLSLVPWIQVSRSRSLLLMVKPAVFLVAVGMGIFLHLFLLAFNALSISILSGVLGGRNSAFSREENVTAVLLIASQKTLPVMVAVVEKLGGALGESGLLVLPCVAAHLSQIIMDSFLVNFWLRRYNSSSASAKTA